MFPFVLLKKQSMEFFSPGTKHYRLIFKNPAIHNPVPSDFRHLSSKCVFKFYRNSAPLFSGVAVSVLLTLYSRNSFACMCQDFLFNFWLLCSLLMAFPKIRHSSGLATAGFLNVNLYYWLTAYGK